MSLTEVKSSLGLTEIGLVDAAAEHWNLEPSQLIEISLCKEQAKLDNTGALCVNTGEFTGRSPKDKYVVEDALTRDTVWWGKVNQAVSPAVFQQLFENMRHFMKGKTWYVRDVYAGADPEHRLKVRVVNTQAWANLFVHNMFIRPDQEALQNFVPEWTVIAAPEFRAAPDTEGLRQHNFTLINFSEKIILIGGSAYTGEIKKGIFTVMNYRLPGRGVLPMHCSANMGESGDTAIFFGLSGTGKTTLSADPARQLIGDDEHGWTPKGVFNFEGGCYAKCIDLSAEKEPQIWQAIRHGALVENTVFRPGSRQIDFSDTSITQNTRVSYPLYHIAGSLDPAVGHVPRHVFFLTCDAFGVLPPISRLTPGQAMYQFISGYTAKVAGTEEGINEPITTFSSCFGEPFLPLHPTQYAQMLGEKLKQSQTQVWLINTGWTGGPYGVGQRISLPFTRAMVQAALRGELNTVEYWTDPVFGLASPTAVPGVPGELLEPRLTWSDPHVYDEKVRHLAQEFVANFAQYAAFASEEMLAAAPRITESVVQ